MTNLKNRHVEKLRKLHIRGHVFISLNFFISLIRDCLHGEKLWIDMYRYVRIDDACPIIADD